MFHYLLVQTKLVVLLYFVLSIQVTKAPEVIQIPSKDSSDEIRKETVAEAKAPTVHPRIVPGAKQKSRRRNKEKVLVCCLPVW